MVKTLDTILIIDDEPSIRDVLKLALELEGFNVVTANHGKAGLDLLLAGLQPKLIILDMMMPVMDGWAFLAALKSEAHHLPPVSPVIIFSASREAAEVAKAQAQGFLRKPVEIEKLYQTVRSFVT